MMPAPALRSALLLLVLFLGVCSGAHAEPGDVDLSFDPGSGSTGSVQAAIIQPDGKYVVAGGVGITRLNSDGSNDPAFTPRVGSYGSLALQPDGKVLAERLDGIDRLNPDGSLDGSFQVTLGPAGESDVSAIVVQADGKVLIGGVFSSVNGSAISGVVRLNQNGSVDATFSTGTVVGGVFAFALQADGKVLIGGRFYNSASVQNRSLLRLNSDGSLDTGFTSETESTGVVISLAVQADGKVLAGGYFLIGSTNNIARLHPNGSVDTTFNTGTGANNTVFSVALQSDGKLVIAGGFTEVNGSARETLARLNANGTLDAGFDPDAGVDVTNGVAAATAQADGKLLISGSFTHVNGTIREGFARLENDGTLDLGFIPNRGLNNTVSSVVVQPDGKVLIGGDFTAINGEARNGIARLNSDGSLDPAVFDRGSAGSFGPVMAIALQPDGKVLIGARNGLARTHANGTLDAGFNPYSGRAATALAVQPDGKILFGGYIVEEFIDPEGAVETYYRAFLTRRNADGTPDSTFQETIGERTAGVGISDLALQPDGKVLVVGSFATFQGAARFGLARIHPSGTLDATFDAGTNNYVSSLVLESDGKLLIGGGFTTVHGSSRRRVARVFGDGSLDASFDPRSGANGVVTSIGRQADGKLVIAGYFSTFDGTARSRIARLQPGGDLDHTFVSDADEGVFALALQPDGNVIIGGSFTAVNGVVRPRVARLEGVALPSPVTFTNTNAIPIHDPTQPGQIGTGTPYPSTIDVAGFAASDAIEKITVTLHDLNHELVDDVDILLVGPGGQSVTLLSDAGGRQEPPAAVTLTFDDAAASAVADDGPLVSGSYRPSNYEDEDRFPLPAPSPSTATTLATFAGTNPNGQWKLYVVDDEVFDAGSILNGWSINIHTGPARPEISVEQPAGTALVAGTGSIDLGSTAPGSSVDLSALIRNLGGESLSGLSASIDGTNAAAFSVVAQSPGTIASNASSTITLRFSPVTRGSHTATLHIVSNDADESPFDIVLTGTGANGSPTAAPDAATTAYQTAVEIDVLANDSDPEADLLIITTASSGSHGSTEIIATESGQRIRYTPAAGFSGTDTFTYSVSDGFGGSAVGTGSVAVGGAPQPEARTLFSKGGAVPGAGEPSSGVPAGAIWKRFGVPSIAAGGRVAFSAVIGTPVESLATLHMGDTAAGPVASGYLVAKQGDPAPGAIGATFAAFKDPLLNDAGTIVFLATLRGAPAPTKSGIWKNYDTQSVGTPINVARTGAEAAGVPGTRWKAFTSVALSDGDPGDELIAFTATMSSGSTKVSRADDAGLWLVRAGNTHLALREGSTLEIASTQKTVKSFVALQPQAGAPGQGHGATAGAVLARVKFSDGSEGVLRASLDEQGVQITAMAMSGDPVGEFDVNIATTGLPTQSSDGRVSLIAKLTGSTLDKDTAVLRTNEFGFDVVAREGHQGIAGDTAFFTSFSSVASSSGDRVAFSASMAGGSVNAGNNTGVWLHNGGSLNLIAREGAQPPGVPAGGKWSSFPSLALPDGAAGPVFIGKLLVPKAGQSNPGGVVAANSTGVWAIDSSGALQLIARTGDLFDGQGKITELTLLGSVPGSPSQRRSFSGDGRNIIYRVTLADGSQHIVATLLP